MATPYTKLDGVNYKIQAGLPSGGVDTLQFTDSASSFTQTIPAATGTLALTTLATGANALVTTDMAAAFRTLDGLVMPSVAGYLTNTPPGSPANGDVYIIGAAPTGAWVGQGGKVTRYSTVAAAWEFYTPKNGWMLQSNSARESYRYTGSAWEIFYQEGTFTPVLGATSGSGATYSLQSGIYTKTGRHVSASLILTCTGLGTLSGAALIGGLPFTSITGSNYFSGSIGNIDNLSFGVGYSMPCLRLGPLATQSNLFTMGSGLTSRSCQISDITLNFQVSATFNYST